MKKKLPDYSLCFTCVNFGALFSLNRLYCSTCGPRRQNYQRRKKK